jgi:nitroreductase
MMDTAVLDVIHARWAPSSYNAQPWSLDHNGSANRHAFHDTGIATGFLMLQAAALGILAHGMAGFDAAKARELYGAPENLRKRNQRRKPRRTLNQFVFAGRWGQPQILYPAADVHVGL